jgi:predicted ester cyclase
MKKIFLIIPIALVLFSLIGCKAKVNVEEQNIEIAKRYIEAFNTKSFADFKELMSPDYAIYSPSGFPDPTSRDELIKNYMEAGKVFANLIWRAKDIIASGDKVVCRIIANATYVGGVPGLPEEERDVEFSMITILRIEDGLIVEEWMEDDQLGLVRQLNMTLQPQKEEN